MKKFIFIFLIIIIVLVLGGIYYASTLLQGSKLGLTKFSSEELFKAGQQRAKLGDYQEAKKYLELALEKSGQNITYLGELAVVKYKMGDYQGAIEEYKKIYEIGEAKGFALNGIANVYRDQKKFDLAKKSYEQGINEDGLYIALYQNFALMLVDQNQLDSAKKVLKQGIEKTGSQELAATQANLK